MMEPIPRSSRREVFVLMLMSQEVLDPCRQESIDNLYRLCTSALSGIVLNVYMICHFMAE